MKNVKVIFIVSIIALGAIIITIAVKGMKNTNKPEYIKQLSVYNEGDGIVFYFILADKNGRPTACDGWVWLEIICEEDVSALWITGKVKKSDFKKTSIGSGPYKRDTILCSFGRFSYDQLKQNVRKHGEEYGHKILANSPGTGKYQEFTKKIEDILSSFKGRSGKAEIRFMWGKLSQNLIKHISKDSELSYNISGEGYISHFDFFESKIAASISLIADLSKVKKNQKKQEIFSIESSESFIF